MARLTEQQHNDRLGRFTASEIYKLMTMDRTGKAWGKTAHGYILANVKEVITGQRQGGFSNAATEWGYIHEPCALLHFELVHGMRIKDPGFLKYNQDSGGTPDGYINELPASVQVKCPYSPEVHKKYCKFVDAADLKRTCKAYYWQMVFEMMCSKVKQSVFISYDPRNQANPMHVVHVPLLEHDEKALLLKLNSAIEMKHLLLESYRELYYGETRAA